MYDPEVDPVTVQAPAMSVRATFAVTLLSLAFPVAAQDARVSGTGGDGSTCSANYATSAAPDADPVRTGKRPDSEKPAIPRGADADAARPPRWHSFLPGMFR